jgi:hypothetical protein
MGGLYPWGNRGIPSWPVGPYTKGLRAICLLLCPTGRIQSPHRPILSYALWGTPKNRRYGPHSACEWLFTAASRADAGLTLGCHPLRLA